MGEVLREIGALNQRGGRMLSTIDLLQAGTIDLRLAAYLMGAMRAGASILCCAGPGGTGKTTLMGALLCFLPAAGVITVVEKPQPPSWYEEHSDPKTPTWFLCHELGPGPWYSYLWGEGARAFLGMPGQGGFCATTVHADNLGELRRLLQGPEISLAPADFARLDLILFMKAMRGQGTTRWQRRVTQAYVSTGDTKVTHKSICQWDPRTDKFLWQLDEEPLPAVTVEAKPEGRPWRTGRGVPSVKSKPDDGEAQPTWWRYYYLLHQLQEKRIAALEDVRREVLKLYESTPLKSSAD